MGLAAATGTGAAARRPSWCGAGCWIIAAGGWGLASSQEQQPAGRCGACPEQGRSTRLPSSRSTRATCSPASERRPRAWLRAAGQASAALEEASARAAAPDALAGPTAAGMRGPGPRRVRLTDASGGIPAIALRGRLPDAAGQRVFAGEYAMRSTVLPTVLGTCFATPGWRADLIDPGAPAWRPDPAAGRGSRCASAPR